MLTHNPPRARKKTMNFLGKLAAATIIAFLLWGIAMMFLLLLPELRSNEQSTLGQAAWFTARVAIGIGVMIFISSWFTDK